MKRWSWQSAQILWRMLKWSPTLECASTVDTPNSQPLAPPATPNTHPQPPKSTLALPNGSPISTRAARMLSPSPIRSTPNKRKPSTFTHHYNNPYTATYYSSALCIKLNSRSLISYLFHCPRGHFIKNWIKWKINWYNTWINRKN